MTVERRFRETFWRSAIRLERYQRQAWSRLKKAIRGFINIKLNALATSAATKTISAALPLADNLR
jgi:hypothetical protein